VRPRIAIPMPHSTDLEYGERAIPQYERAVSLAGGEPVRIPLDQSRDALKPLIGGCSAVLLPGSNADVDPGKFGQALSPHTAAADLLRERTDFHLLEDAYAKRKPVLCICYGLQSLNVFRGGSLVQHIPDFLPEAMRSKVNHEAGKNVMIAHSVAIDEHSLLSRMIETNGQRTLNLPVNSSHHQSADAIGEGLRIVARCPDDGIVEALEGTDADHFVTAVQWHPERSVESDQTSHNLFRALIDATR